MRRRVRLLHLQVAALAAAGARRDEAGETRARPSLKDLGKQCDLCAAQGEGFQSRAARNGPLSAAPRPVALKPLGSARRASRKHGFDGAPRRCGGGTHFVCLLCVEAKMNA